MTRRRMAPMPALVAVAALCLASADSVGAPADSQRAQFERSFRRTWGPRIEAALDGVTPLPVPEHPELPPDVKDGAFGYLVSLLDAGTYGRVTGTQFRQVLEKTGRSSRIPYETIAEVRRAPAGTAGEGWVRVAFSRPLDVPVPYSILGYHPGSLLSSQQVTAREWHARRSVISDPAGEVTGALEIEDLTLWAFVEGRVNVDIDGWIDALMGSGLDDTYMIGLAFFRMRGQAYAMALGYNRRGEPRSGALALADDEIRFPTPRELKAAARDLRGRLVRHLAEMGLPAWLPE